MVDSYSDGMCCQYGEGGYEVTDANGVVLVSGGEFGALDSKAMSKGVTSVEETAVVSDFAIFPNPSNGLFNITMNLTRTDDISLKVYNAMGALVHSHDLGNLSMGEYFYNLDLSRFASGMYKIVAVSSKGVSVNSVQLAR